MQTRCPHCETRFRVTDSQLASAEGFVRCGVCKEVFNALPDELEQDIGLLQQGQNEGQLSEGDPVTEYPATSDEHAIEEFPAEENGQTRLSSDDDRELEQHDAVDGETETHRLADDETDEHERSYAARETGVGTAADTAADTDSEAAEETISKADKEEIYDLFDDSADSGHHVVPEELRSEYNGRQSQIISTALWSIGTLLLVATLFLEYIWFNRDSFARIPDIRTEIVDLCDQIDCADIAIRAPDSIELVSRNVYSHPNHDQGLIVDITMKNNANFAQPYPVLKIVFSDIRGRIIAARNFMPEEYLSIVQQNKDSLAVMLPDTSSNITLEVLDPGEQARTYEFDFL